MFLTSRSRTPPSSPRRDPDEFPSAQLGLLALIRVAEPIALTSLYPYAFKLALFLHAGPRSDASFYSGLLIAAFALFESLTGMFWGGLSDKLGRKPVLLFGCAGTIVSLLVVGFATNIWVAMLGRALGGLLNGNIGVIQTMVGELVKKPEHEPKAFAIMPFFWSIGTIVGPAIGGLLAMPSESYPSVFPADGLFGRLPFLLPNLVCAGLLVIAIVAGTIFIEETHPDMQTWSTEQDLETTDAETPLIATAGANEHAPANLKDQSYGTFNAVDVQERETWIVDPNNRRPSDASASSPKVFSRRIVMLVIALGIFTYHCMTYENLFPIYLQQRRAKPDVSSMSVADVFSGGLGLTTQQVGIIMACNGVIALFVQGVVFPWIASWLGVWKVFVLVAAGHPIAYLMVPYLVLLPERLVYPGIYTCLAVRQFFSILEYPVLLILLKEASPGPSYLGKVNGLAASVGAACRTLASPVCGYLYGVGIAMGFTPLAWFVSAGVALLGSLQIFLMHRSKPPHAIVHDARAHFDEEDSDTRPSPVVMIIVEDYESYDEDSSDDERLSLLGKNAQ